MKHQNNSHICLMHSVFSQDINRKYISIKTKYHELFVFWCESNTSSKRMKDENSLFVFERNNVLCKKPLDLD